MQLKLLMHLFFLLLPIANSKHLIFMVVTFGVGVVASPPGAMGGSCGLK